MGRFAYHVSQGRGNFPECALLHPCSVMDASFYPQHPFDIHYPAPAHPTSCHDDGICRIILCPATFFPPLPSSLSLRHKDYS